MKSLSIRVIFYRPYDPLHSAVSVYIVSDDGENGFSPKARGLAVTQFMEMMNISPEEAAEKFSGIRFADAENPSWDNVSDQGIGSQELADLTGLTTYSYTQERGQDLVFWEKRLPQ